MRKSEIIMKAIFPNVILLGMASGLSLANTSALLPLRTSAYFIFGLAFACLIAGFIMADRAERDKTFDRIQSLLFNVSLVGMVLTAVGGIFVVAAWFYNRAG